MPSFVFYLFPRCICNQIHHLDAYHSWDDKGKNGRERREERILLLPKQVHFFRNNKWSQHRNLKLSVTSNHDHSSLGKYRKGPQNIKRGIITRSCWGELTPSRKRKNSLKPNSFEHLDTEHCNTHGKNNDEQDVITSR